MGGSSVTTPGLHRDTSPVFHPTSQNFVFFLSTRSGANNVWTQTLLSSEAGQQLTNFPISIDNLRVAPNYIMFTAEIYDDCGTNFQCTADRDGWYDANPNSGIVFSQLFVRHWDVLNMPGKTSQLFTQRIISTGNGFATMGPVNRVSANMPPANTPVPPDGGVEQISIKPSFDRIAFTVALVNNSTAWTTGWQIWEVAVDPNSGAQTAAPKQISQGFNGARTQDPKYDPSGRYIAFLAMDRAGFEADRHHIEIYDSQRSSTTALTSGWDRSISEFAWTADGATILACLDEDGSHKLYSINSANGQYALVLGNGTISGVKVAATYNRVVFSAASFSAPADLHTFIWNPSTRKAGTISSVTELNPTFPTSVFDPGSKFYYASEDGSQVQGWFFKPLGWRAGVNYPFVLLIHGGPQGAWTSGWSYRWNPQLWAQRGYAVAMINPHGSTGFGQAYCDAVSGNWGGIPFRDLMTGVRQILSSNPWIDSSRISACGASYGGFMINWLQGQVPGMFSSLVVHDGLYDVPISYGSTDELWFPEWEFKGTPWTNPAGYQKWNPANYADKWSTPMLVVHGGKDYRVDLAHGLSAFTTLQRRGIPSKFLYYPLENHWVSKPTNSIQWYSEVLGWLDTYTKNRS
jgi:dipeptidyl aminopeptidase/acylaminoacyl peptidase